MKFLHIFAFLLCVSVGKLNKLVTYTSLVLILIHFSAVVETVGRYLSTPNEGKQVRIRQDQEFTLVVPFCLHSFYEPIFLWCIEGTRFEKILTCFPYCCSVSVNFVFKFLPQLALASSKYQMLSAPCFLFVLFCILSFTSFSFLALHYLGYSQRCFSLHAKLHDAFSQ